MKVKSEHHKVSGSSSAKAHRIRAANLPSHRLSEIQRSEVLRSAGGKLSPIGYSCHRKPASINETIILLLRGTLGTQLPGAGGWCSGIHHKELGDGQYAEGTPQAGAGAAVGKCLTVRPVAWKRGVRPPCSIALLYWNRLARKEWRCPRHRPSSSKEEKDKGTAKQSHSSGTETELRPVLQSMGKLFAAPSTNPAANATAVPTALHRGRDTASWIPWSIDCNESWQQVLRRNHHRYFECGVLIPFGELFRDRLREDDPSPSTWRRRRTFGSVRCSSPHQSPRANALASAFSTHDEPSVWNSGGTHRAHDPESARVGDSRATGVSGAGQLSTNCSWTSPQKGVIIASDL